MPEREEHDGQEDAERAVPAVQRDREPYDQRDHDDHEHHGHDHENAHDHDHGQEEHDDHDHALIVDRLPAGLWEVVPGSSEVNFRARGLLGLVPVNGFFEGFSGELQIDDDGAAHGTLVILTGTLQTGIERRDADLKSPRFLGSAEFPQMTFTLESVEPGGDDHLQLSGHLALSGKTIALTFPVYAIEHGDHLHIEGRVEVNHHAAGFNWAKPGMVAKVVRADVALTLTSAA